MQSSRKYAIEIHDDQIQRLIELLPKLSQGDKITIHSNISPKDIYEIIEAESNGRKFDFLSIKNEEREWTIILRKR